MGRFLHTISSHGLSLRPSVRSSARSCCYTHRPHIQPRIEHTSHAVTFSYAHTKQIFQFVCQTCPAQSRTCIIVRSEAENDRWASNIHTLSRLASLLYAPVQACSFADIRIGYLRSVPSFKYFWCAFVQIWIIATFFSSRRVQSSGRRQRNMNPRINAHHTKYSHIVLHFVTYFRRHLTFVFSSYGYDKISCVPCRFHKSMPCENSPTSSSVATTTSSSSLPPFSLIHSPRSRQIEHVVRRSLYRNFQHPRRRKKDIFTSQVSSETKLFLLLPKAVWMTLCI